MILKIKLSRQNKTKQKKSYKTDFIFKYVKFLVNLLYKESVDFQGLGFILIEKKETKYSIMAPDIFNSNSGKNSLLEDFFFY